jgi:hypothetical protein
MNLIKNFELEFNVHIKFQASLQKGFSIGLLRTCNILAKSGDSSEPAAFRRMMGAKYGRASIFKI